MKGKIVTFILAGLLLISMGFSGNVASAGDMSFLSFDSSEMISFDHYFKQYIASCKGTIEKEKGLKALTETISAWNTIVNKAKTQSSNDEHLLGRLTVIKGLLLQAVGLAQQKRYVEALEVSVPIRSEIYELHRALDIMTTEDYMIFFHNGVMHRAEPLIKEGRYLELMMLIPLINETASKFENPPKGVTDVEQYNTKYRAMLKAVNAYIEAIRKINNYVDPEYGALMLQKKIEDAHAETHKKFGAIYLSFPKDLIAKK